MVDPEAGAAVAARYRCPGAEDPVGRVGGELAQEQFVAAGLGAGFGVKRTVSTRDLGEPHTALKNILLKSEQQGAVFNVA